MRYWTLLICFLINITVNGQKKDSTWIGTLTGIVRDSVHDYELPSATVAIYSGKDTSLVSFQLTNNLGSFSFKQLPTGKRLQIIVTYIGYKKYYKTILMNPVMDLGALNLEPKGEELDEVVITVPPVQLNGDTLEFNASAFKLDPAAQAEDLLRLLPGVTVWSDGTITVNGRQVSQVLVDGKPFFGGDTKVATQNIPKDAVDKIQVYKQAKDRDNSLDSMTFVNIKLMKNKHNGFFGKISAGGGTNKTYEADASVNYFAPRTQLGVAAAANNVNKVANDVSTILRNSTFKGVGASIEYQPEMSVPGTNKANNGGIMYQHDFIPDPGYFKNNRLTIDYFAKDHYNTLNQQSQTTTRLMGDSSLLQQAQIFSDTRNTGQSLNVKYDKKDEVHEFYSNLSLDLNDHHDKTHSNTVTPGFGGQIPDSEILSSNSADIQNDSKSEGVVFSTGIVHHPGIYDISLTPKEYNIDYSISFDNDKGNRLNESRFVSKGTADKLFNRSYDNQHTHTNQKLAAGLGDFAPWLFGMSNWSLQIRLKLQNDLEVITDHTNNIVKDESVLNNYLTNNAHYTIINEMPGLHTSRSFIKSLDNRYKKTFTADLHIRGQFWSQKNASDHDFQHLSQSYQRFVPVATLSYMNEQFLTYTNMYNLSFETSEDYPGFQQLVPLTDSSNEYNIQVGNPLLRPADKRDLNFVMNHNSLQSKDPFNYTINLRAGYINHYFSDASIIDSLGRSIHYIVNGEREKHLSAAVSIKKAIRVRNNQLEFQLRSGLNLSKTPNQLNGTWNISNIFGSNHQLGVAYTYGNLLTVNLSETVNFYNSHQSDLNRQVISSSAYATVLSGSIYLTSRLSMSSNLSFNHNASSNYNATNYTIWNANAFYRIGKMKTIELKLSALDLLHQNKGVSYTSNNNILTYNTVNVLQQYFMCAVVWYPRRFGKNEKFGKNGKK
jgi:hypothetical protein